MLILIKIDYFSSSAPKFTTHCLQTLTQIHYKREMQESYLKALLVVHPIALASHEIHPRKFIITKTI
jgi:hypothetical protein